MTAQCECAAQAADVAESCAQEQRGAELVQFLAKAVPRVEIPPVLLL